MVHRKGVYHYGRKTRHHSQRNGGIFEHCPDEKAARSAAEKSGRKRTAKSGNFQRRISANVSGCQENRGLL